MARTTRCHSCMFLAVAVCLTVLVAPALAADWPNWRGPNHDGIAPESDWLQPGNLAILWRAKVGTGFSSLVIADGRLFTLGNTAASGAEQDVVWCLDINTGRELWRFAYTAELAASLYEGGPNATPTFADGRVYTLSKQGRTYCLDAETGKLVWFRNLQDEEGMKPPTWGFAGSPLVLGNRVLYNVGDAGLALDAQTGKTLWKSNSEKAGYATGVPFTLPGGDQTAVALLTGEELLALNPADGSAYWRLKWKTAYDINAADPIIHDNQVFVSSGYNRGCAVANFTADSAEIVWENKAMRNQVNSCVLMGESIYGFDGQVAGKGKLTCLSWADGETRWQQEGLGTGSLTGTADGKLIILGEQGMLVIADASSQGYKALRKARVLNEKCWTTPILTNGRIYARDALGNVVCVQPGGAVTPATPAPAGDN